MPHWSEAYIGLPYEHGIFDCTHLLVAVQREVFGRNVDIPVERDAHVFKLSQQIEVEKEHYLYRINDDEKEDGDVVLMRGHGRLNHVGVYAKIDGVDYVLHNLRNAGSVTLHKLRDLDRLNLQVEGFYRCIEK